MWGDIEVWWVEVIRDASEKGHSVCCGYGLVFDLKVQMWHIQGKTNMWLLVTCSWHSPSPEERLLVFFFCIIFIDVSFGQSCVFTDLNADVVYHVCNTTPAFIGKESTTAWFHGADLPILFLYWSAIILQSPPLYCVQQVAFVPPKHLWPADVQTQQDL